MRSLNLFIDESGTANPKVQKNGCYIVCGCLVNEENREYLKIKSDQIKFKYWEKTDIVFHSREIWRKEGGFSILKDRDEEDKFLKNLFDFLINGGYQILAVIVDNAEAAKHNWDHRKVYKETSNIIVKNFIFSLLATKSKGRLSIESASSEKDFYFHKAASHFLAKGFPEFNVSYEEVQDVFTEVSFVSKKNFDIEEQIADLLAYGVKLKFLGREGKKLTNYDKRILRILNTKLFTFHPQTGIKKKKFYSKIESFKILP